MVAWNQPQSETIQQLITVDEMPLALRLAWEWQGRALRLALHYSGVRGYGGYEEEAQKAKDIIDGIYDRRLAYYLSAECTCRPDNVTACDWCRTPAHIKAAYTV